MKPAGTALACPRLIIFCLRGKLHSEHALLEMDDVPIYSMSYGELTGLILAQLRPYGIESRAASSTFVKFYEGREVFVLSQGPMDPVSGRPSEITIYGRRWSGSSVPSKCNCDVRVSAEPAKSVEAFKVLIFYQEID